MAFSIAMFFLVMQFLWKYIDDLIGKGIELTVLLKLLFYVSATLIPLALPLAVLFSSIMACGNLAEHNELTAMKSSGLSLLRIMYPMFFFIVIISLIAFYFTNYLLPIANYKWRAIIYDIQDKKPTFGIVEGIFYNDIDGYSIKVDKKDDATGVLEGIVIYDYADASTEKTIKAKRGEMLKSEDSRFLLLKLVDGAIYEEISPLQTKGDRFPFQKSFFGEAIIRFDLSGFEMDETNEDLFKNDYEMMSFMQLSSRIDTLNHRQDIQDSAFRQTLKSQMMVFNDRLKAVASPAERSPFDSPTLLVDSLIHIDSLKEMELKVALNATQNSIRTSKNMLITQIRLREKFLRSLVQHVVSWHKKFTLSFAVIILFFIGAPLGAIIKKGGLGTPLVFATLFFLLYYVLTIMGENMVVSGFITPWKGIWMSTLLLAPLGVFLTYKATRDSALFDRDAYKRFFQKIIRRG